jgi:hypothetical protein
LSVSSLFFSLLKPNKDLPNQPKSAIHLPCITNKPYLLYVSLVFIYLIFRKKKKGEFLEQISKKKKPNRKEDEKYSILNGNPILFTQINHLRLFPDQPLLSLLRRLID